MAFLPKNYKAPLSAGGYMKLQDGENIFRILSSAITGYSYWTTENKPVRGKEPFITIPSNIRLKDDGFPTPIKHFWAFVVWNYNSGALEIMEITQTSIQNFMLAYVNDKQWGDPKEYDIKINRTGAGLETKYTVIASPHAPAVLEITKAYADKPINLKALYEGGNPFEVKSNLSVEDIKF